MHIAFIAFGSNMGQREKYIDSALQKMKNVGMEICKISPIYETEPYGVTNQDSFLNGVCKVKTKLSPQELLNILLNIEKELHRVRKLRWGPRTIDLDILLYDDMIIKEENLQVPHIDLENREFVLRPLFDIAPDLIHPVLNKTIAEIYNNFILLNGKKL